MTPADEETLGVWMLALNDRLRLLERRLWWVSLTGFATALALLMAVTLLR